MLDMMIDKLEENLKMCGKWNGYHQIMEENVFMWLPK